MGKLKVQLKKIRGDFLKKFFKLLTLSLFIILSFIFSYSSYIYYSLPDEYKITENCGMRLESYRFIKAHSEDNQKSMALYDLSQNSKNKYLMNIKFLNLIPIKTVNVEFDAMEGSYEYRVDFDLGDICHIEIPEMEISADAVLIGCGEVIKKGTWSLTLEFGTPILKRR